MELADICEIVDASAMSRENIVDAHLPGAFEEVMVQVADEGQSSIMNEKERALAYLGEFWGGIVIALAPARQAPDMHSLVYMHIGTL